VNEAGSDENQRPKKLVADLSLRDEGMLKSLIERKGGGPFESKCREVRTQFVLSRFNGSAKSRCTIQLP